MALYRQIYTTFWSDPKIDDDFTPEDKYFYLYLLTNPHTNICGCYEISMKQLIRELGYNEDTVRVLIRRMEDIHGVIRYSPKTKEILLLNWHRYNWSKSPNFVKGIYESLPYIKSDEFREYIEKNLEELIGQSGTVADGLSTSASASASAPTTASDIKEIEEVKEKEEEKSVKDDVKKAVAYWNEVGLQRVVRMDVSSVRGKQMAARIKEYGIDEVLRAIDNAANSVYLQGMPWFAMDWFVKPNNFPKVLEGKYNDSKKKGTFADMLRKEMADGRDRCS